MAGTDGAVYRATTNSSANIWNFHSKLGFDLTRQAEPRSSAPRLTMDTTTTPITVDPEKSALVVIDMQNYFLHPALGRRKGRGHQVAEKLATSVVPAARKNGIQVIWLNWGLTDQDVFTMPPAVTRTFGMACVNHNETNPDRQRTPLDKFGHRKGESSHKYSGLGTSHPTFHDPDTGSEINPGRCLMRGTWNADLFSPLNNVLAEGRAMPLKPDVLFHKNRMSGMSGSPTDCEKFLQAKAITTLFFTGIDTDHCVGGTLQDCYNKGFDCILLSDVTATTSPPVHQECMEWNTANTWGFVTSSDQFPGKSDHKYLNFS